MTRAYAVFALMFLLATFSPGSPSADATGYRFAFLGSRVGSCIDRQAAFVATRPVDLETAAIAVLARCKGNGSVPAIYLYRIATKTSI